MVDDMLLELCGKLSHYNEHEKLFHYNEHVFFYTESLIYI